MIAVWSKRSVTCSHPNRLGSHYRPCSVVQGITDRPVLITIRGIRSTTFVVRLTGTAHSMTTAMQLLEAVLGFDSDLN